MDAQLVDTRALILDHLRATPGLSTRAVARAVGVDESTADYHLRRLRQSGGASSETVGREVVWYAGGCGFCPILRQAIPVLRRPEALAVAMALDETPTSASRLAQRAGMRVGTVRWIAEVLEKCGILTKTASGRLTLHEGAHVCVSKAAGAQRCELWGKCPLSREAVVLQPKR